MIWEDYQIKCIVDIIPGDLLISRPGSFRIMVQYKNEKLSHQGHHSRNLQLTTHVFTCHLI